MAAIADVDEVPVTPDIIQFWDARVPAAVASLLESVQELNPAHRHRLFDDRSAARFIDEAFGADMRKRYENCAIPAMRSDLFRYCWLVRHGGVYIDADYRARKPMTDMLRPGRRAHLLLREKGIANGMMHAAQPEDPLLLAILDRSIENIEARRSNNVWSVTGPSVLQRLHKDTRYRSLFDNVELVPEADFYRYFEAVAKLDYKNRDDHWLNARRLGTSLFLDEAS